MTKVKFRIPHTYILISFLIIFVAIATYTVPAC